MTALLLAFLLQSTLWLGGTFLFLRWRSQASPRVRESLWKTALAASLIGPLAQQLPGFEPLPGWSLATGALNPTAPEVSAGPVAGSGQEPRVIYLVPDATAIAAATGAPRPWSETATGASGNALESELASAGLAASEGSTGAGVAAWVQRLPLLWAAIAGLLSLLALSRLAGFHWALRHRTPVRDLRLRTSLVGLARAARLRRVPRLSHTPEIASPAAFGILRPEICLPVRWPELSAIQQDSMLAHEVAHHMRRDPAWLLGLQALERLLFFQPLLRLARRQLMEAIEERCDAWGARQTGDPLAMARVLTEVAVWLTPGGRSLPVPAMARRRSLLRNRMQRLIDGQPEHVVRRGAGRSLLALVFLAAAPFAAPALVPSAPLDAAALEAQDLPGEWLLQPPSPVDPVDLLLQPFDLQLTALEFQLAELLLDLGPLQDQPHYQEILTSISQRLQRLRVMRGLLADLLSLLSPEAEPVSAADMPFQPHR